MTLGTTFTLLQVIARVFAFRGKGEVEIHPRLQPAARLQFRPQVLVGGARVGGRFEHHHRALGQVRRHRPAGLQDVGDVRLAVLVQRRRHANDHRPHLADAAEIGGGRQSAGRRHLGDATTLRCA